MKESSKWNLLANAVMIIFTALALIPFILLIIASFTDNQWATVNGFSFWPAKWSLEAYSYIASSWKSIGHAYLMTVVVTVLGTFFSLCVTTGFAYALSDTTLPGHRILNFMCVFTMLFSGGIVASYYTWSQIFHIRNTMWALVFPGLMMNAFNVILVKNYFRFSVPASLIEAARIDGAGEIKIFFRIVLPLSTPILATIGLMTGLLYWNDWNNGLYYLSQRGGSDYYTIQILLNQINENVQYLADYHGSHGDCSGGYSSGVSNLSVPSEIFRKRYYHGSCKGVNCRKREDIHYGSENQKTAGRRVWKLYFPLFLAAWRNRRSPSGIYESHCREQHRGCLRGKPPTSGFCRGKMVAGYGCDPG